MSATDATPVDVSTLGDKVAFWMEVHQGFKETLGPNLGPEINEWNRLVGSPPGSEWCAATAYAAHFYTSRDLGVVNAFPRTAGALRVWALADPSCRVVTPQRGDVGILDHGHGKGHVIICTRPEQPVIGLSWASGNTNAAGSRTGDSLLAKTGDPEEVHHGELVGWLRFSLAVTRPALVA